MTDQMQEAIDDGLFFALANIHTVTVCRVEKVKEKTIDVKPVINRVVNGKSEELPTFVDVPPIFMSGGASYEAHPIAAGDYCLLMISERCYDAWFEGSDFVKPVEMRMHDYSDGFALVGIHNRAGAITIPSIIEQIGDKYHQGNYERDGDTTFNGDNTHNGNLTQTGDQTVTGQCQASVKYSAPILEGILRGVGGGDAVSDKSMTASELHAQNGYTGTIEGVNGSFQVVDGIILG